MKVPILQSPRLTLRPIKLADAKNYVRWFRDKKVMLHFAQRCYRLSLKEEQKWVRQQWRRQDVMNWAIIVAGKHIGGTGVQLNEKNKSAYWGIVIGERKQWGQGYAQECVKLVADYVFIKLKYVRLELLVEMPNEKAVRAYKKAGFKLEGVKRKANYNIFFKKHVDEGMMSILREEWLKKHK